MFTSRTVIMAVCVFGNLFTSYFAQAQNRQRFPVEMKNSEMSIQGDESFITGRYYWKPLPHGYIWMETLTVKGGYLTFYELDPSFQYNGSLSLGPEVVKIFNRSYADSKRGLSIVRSEVKSAENGLGKYAYSVKGNSNGTCTVATQLFGNDSFGFAGSQGNKRYILGICWSAHDGSAEALEKFLHKFLTVVRFDEGKLTKQKLAGGYYERQKDNKSKQPGDFSANALATMYEGDERLQKINSLEKEGVLSPDEAAALRQKLAAKISNASRQNNSLTVPVTLNWEGVDDQVIGELKIVGLAGKGELITRGSISCNGFWLHQKGKYGTPTNPQGTWTLKCENGLSAGGIYESSQMGVGSGFGTDSKGRKLTFKYGT